MKYHKFAVKTLILFAFLNINLFAQENFISLHNKSQTFKIDPGTLEARIQKKDFSVNHSAKIWKQKKFQMLEEKKNFCSWEYPEENISVNVTPANEGFRIEFEMENPGTFSWPEISLTEETKALIWPHWEGRYISPANQAWWDFLKTSSPWNTTESISMPFWGMEIKSHIISFLIENPYHNKIQFYESNGSKRMKFIHEAPPNGADKKFGFTIILTEANSPIEPAKQYRKYLEDKDQFVTLKEKAEKIPGVKKLASAAHVYLWGDNLLSVDDIPGNQWGEFCRELILQSESPSPTPGKKLWEMMKPEIRKNVNKISQMKWPHNYIKTTVTRELSRILEKPDFYDQDSWENTDIPEKAENLLNNKICELSKSEICQLNSILLYSAFEEFMNPVDSWGEAAVSTKLLHDFKEAGFDRMKFCVDGWSGPEKRPDVAETAKRLGFLFGTYDSFHSIHNPSLNGTDASWPTAQFDRELYEKGAIVNRNEKKRSGFKKKGFLLSPIAAFPWVKKRVTRNMNAVPYNYYFIDCDAFGQLYDDYSPEHSCSQKEDGEARNERMAWIRDTFNAVIGSEGGSFYAAPVIHVAEGITFSGFGWGDPDMKDPESDYFLGKYYPPNGPGIFIKPVPVKQKYKTLHYDPQYRLPLYEIVFHDSVVATHHWGSSSLKFKNIRNFVALTELLYMTPPMYHINRENFDERTRLVNEYYRFFSPLHRKTMFSKMTGFEFLTEDRKVQCTEFGSGVKMIANFRNSPYEHKDKIIPAMSILSHSKKSGEIKVFTPDLQK